MEKKKKRLGEGKRYKIIISVKWLWAWFHLQECCRGNLRFFFIIHKEVHNLKNWLGNIFMNKQNTFVLLWLLDSQFWDKKGWVARLVWPPALAEALSSYFYKELDTRRDRFFIFHEYADQTRRILSLSSTLVQVWGSDGLSATVVCFSLVPWFVSCL